jgi:hypothetical protein
LKGVGAGTIWVELLALTVYAAVVLAFATVRLRRQWN